MKLLHPCSLVPLRFVSALAAALLPLACAAQAVPTAFKTTDISAFGGYLNASPAYGPTRNNGEAFGAIVTRYFRIPVDTALEGRVNLTNGTYIQQHTYLGGLQIKADFLHRLHPYADFLAGQGTLHFNTTATGHINDNSIVYNYGAGLDLDLIHNFQLRADFQHQIWTIGRTPSSFAPNIFFFGVNYVIPFRDYKNQRDLNP